MMSVYRRSLLLLALAACSHSKAGTVVFGAAGPWDQEYGKANKQGIELAVDEINASPAWSSDRHLEIVFANDSGNGVRASEVAQQLVEIEPIVDVVGHVNSGAMVSAAHVYDKHLAAVATTATSPSLTGISPWAFRVIPSDSANGLTIARFADKLGRKRAAVLYENNPYGRGLADNFRKSFHGDIISIDPIAEGDGNFEVFVSWYKSSHPDLVFVAGTDASGVAFLKEGKARKQAAPLLTSSAATAGRHSPRIRCRRRDLLLALRSFSSAQDPRPEVQTFVNAYKREVQQRSRWQRCAGVRRHQAPRGRRRKSRPRSHQDSRIPRQPLGQGSIRRCHTGTIRFGGDGDPIGKRMVMTRVHQGALIVESNQ